MKLQDQKKLSNMFNQMKRVLLGLKKVKLSNGMKYQPTPPNQIENKAG